MDNLFNTSLWGDEGFSAILSMKSIPDILKTISRDTSPPLWNICEHIVFKTLGTDEVYIRGLAFLFFLGTIFFTYKIGVHFFSKKTGAIAALLTFLNPFFFSYAFEGRMYSIMSFGVAGSMYFFLKRRLWPYVFFTLWALYSHHFAFFIILVQGIWFLYDFFSGERYRAIKQFKAFVVVGIGYLPWLYPLYKQVTMVKGGFWLGTPTAKDLAVLFFDYLANGIKSPIKLPVLDINLYLIGLILVFITLIIRNWLKNYKATLFLLSWFLLPILLTFLISQNFQSIFFNRYLLYTIPAAMLILASNKRGASSYILIGMIVVIFSTIDYHYFTHPTKLPFRQYSEYVKSVSSKRDLLINWNSSSHHLWETKYYGIPAPLYIPPTGGDLPYYVGTALMDDSDVIHQLPDSAKKVGVVTSGPIEEVKITNYTRIEDKEFGNIKYILLIKNEKNN